jgi:Metallo-beta-lactamase superfamily
LLRITFAESGRGDTIFVEFPTGEIAVIDSYPSSSDCRPPIEKEIRGRPVAFVCLTHPHDDHGLGLLSLLKSGMVHQFWHSLTEIEPFIYFVTQAPKFRSSVAYLAERIRKKRAKFLLDLWSTVKCRSIESLSFDASRESVDIGEVKVHFLAPARDFLISEFERLHRSLSGKGQAPDPNRFSLVLGIEYQKTLVLLGSDTPKAAWRGAYSKWQKNKLPKAVIVKIPHHGASDAFDLRPPNQKYPPDQKPVNCWDLCAKTPIAVIFAGDFGHPDPEVLKALERRTQLISLFDLQAVQGHRNPLGLQAVGARSVNKSLRPQTFCKIVFEIDSNGKTQLICK